MSRANAARQYLSQLVLAYEELEAERQKLLAAAQRIPEIQAEKQDLIADAQLALDKYNALTGQSLTLADIRNQIRPPNQPNIPAEGVP